MPVEVARVERDLGISLGVWGLGSTIVGLALYRRGSTPAMRAFGGQTAGWGAIDAAISAVAHFRSRRANQPDDDTRRRRLRRALAINTALDVGYVAAGVVLLKRADLVAKSARLRNRRSAAELQGDGAAVVIQGGFLFVLDGVNLLRL